MTISGKWQKLTQYLLKKSEEIIELSDEEIRRIVESTDHSTPLRIDFTEPEYSIIARAKDAGYDVAYSTDPRIKKFTKWKS